MKILKSRMASKKAKSLVKARGKKMSMVRAKVAKKMAKGEILVVGSKVREYIKSKGCLTSGELIPQLSSRLCCILDSAIERAKANNRKTVNPFDIKDYEKMLEDIEDLKILAERRDEPSRPLEEVEKRLKKLGLL